MLDAVACNNLIRLDGVAAARDPGGHSGAVMPPAVRRLKTQQVTEVPLTRNRRQSMGETPRGNPDRRATDGRNYDRLVTGDFALNAISVFKFANKIGSVPTSNQVNHT